MSYKKEIETIEHEIKELSEILYKYIMCDSEFYKGYLLFLKKHIHQNLIF